MNWPTLPAICSIVQSLAESGWLTISPVSGAITEAHACTVIVAESAEQHVRTVAILIVVPVRGEGRKGAEVAD